MKLLSILLVLLLASCASIPSITDSCDKGIMKEFGQCIEEPEIVKLPTYKQLFRNSASRSNASSCSLQL
ncbi:MAG: hypothetical protein CM15mV38_1060 [uncultured marine virus]|nr:MAG: hypothetical protein CM15mV38_1060 [uncultured marine virus]